jgi:hypothetical protein
MRPNRSQLTCLLPCLGLLAASVASPARAQTAVPPPPAPPAAPVAAPAPPPPPPPSPAPVAPATPANPALPLGDALQGPAKEAYESAKLLFGVGDFGAALIKFNAAYDASKDVRLLWNVATCESKLHHYARAVGLVHQYLKQGAGTLPEQDRLDAEQTVRVLEPLTSTVRVTVNEAGAEVYVDDQLVGVTPIEPQLVDIGVHKVRVHKAEFEDSTQDMTVNGGAVVSVDLTLHPIVHEGTVSVHAGPKDAILLDGQPVGAGSWSGNLKSGGHTLRVTAQGMLPYQSEVLVQDGQQRNIEVTLNAEPSKGLPAWVWVVGGVVVAGGLGTGGYFLFKPTSQYNGPQGNLSPGVVYTRAPIHF